MTKKIAKFLNSYKFNVKISFDGSEYYHNQERKTSIGIGSYKIIKENINFLNQFSNIKKTLRINITDQNKESIWEPN